MKHNRSKNKQKGFTITESLVTMTILAVGITGISHLQVDLLRAGAVTRDRAQAITLAEKKLEELRADALSENNYTTSLSDDHPDPIENERFHLYWTITPDSLGTYAQIQVSTRWSNRQGNHEVVLNTIIPSASPALSGEPLLASTSP